MAPDGASPLNSETVAALQVSVHVESDIRSLAASFARIPGPAQRLLAALEFVDAAAAGLGLPAVSLGRYVARRAAWRRASAVQSTAAPGNGQSVPIDAQPYVPWASNLLHLPGIAVVGVGLGCACHACAVAPSPCTWR